MFRIGNTLISEEIIENYFHCNLSRCKGACCVEGNGGLHLKKMKQNYWIKTLQKYLPIFLTMQKKLLKKRKICL